jgi:hypothetical protein
MDIFGKKEIISTKSSVDKALKKLEDKYEDRQQALFSESIIQEPTASFSKLDSQTGPGHNGQKVSRGRGKGGVDGKQLDLFEYQATQLPKIGITGKLRTKQKVSTATAGRADLSETGYVIQSPQDAATLLSHLVDDPQENAYFFPLDKDFHCGVFYLQ